VFSSGFSEGVDTRPMTPSTLSDTGLNIDDSDAGCDDLEDSECDSVETLVSTSSCFFALFHNYSFDISVRALSPLVTEIIFIVTASTKW
jgi:hypothetical protein